MLNLGTPELLVIAVVALLVLGPTRLPGAARQAGKAIPDVRRMTSGFQSELTNAMQEPMATVKEAMGSDTAPAATPARPRRTAPLRAAERSNAA